MRRGRAAGSARLRSSPLRRSVSVLLPWYALPEGAASCSAPPSCSSWGTRA